VPHAFALTLLLCLLGCLCLLLLCGVAFRALLADVQMVLQVSDRGLEKTQEGLHNAYRPQAAHL
jgi:hypothetical protein